MLVRRSIRLAAVILFLSALSPLAHSADSAKPTWEVSRTTSPDTVAELRTLETTVKTVVDKVTPATVAVMFGVGAGSGVIVSEDGLVLTAAHVVSAPNGMDLKTCRLVLADGKTTVKAKVLGRNPKTDSGMVQIIDPVPKTATWPGAKDGKWPFVEIAPSEAVKKGQWVVSLGHPGGPKPDRRAPVRVGQVVNSYLRENVLVSDCTLVGGDSGGPLFDLSGKVIGIHSRIGPYLEENIHVPTKAFKDEWDDLKAGYVIYGKGRNYVGVVLNREGENDLRIDKVNPDTPAERAGLEVGDVILTFDGKAADTSDNLDKLIADSKAGKTIPVEVRRNGETVKVFVTVGKLFERPQRRQPKQ
jgi:serine protease Do